MVRRRRSSNPEAPRKRLTGEKLQKLRQQVFTYYGRQCWLCGGDGADTIDHIIPVMDGGDDSLDNLRPAHGRKSKLCSGNFSRKRTQSWEVSPTPGDEFSEIPEGITLKSGRIIRRKGTMITTDYLDWEKLGLDHPWVVQAMKF